MLVIPPITVADRVGNITFITSPMHTAVVKKPIFFTINVLHIFIIKTNAPFIRIGISEGKYHQVIWKLGINEGSDLPPEVCFVHQLIVQFISFFASHFQS